MTTDKPTMMARRSGDQLRIWCNWCAEHHFHGARGGLGHRVAHCTSPTSPYLQTGYVLVAESV